MPTALSAGPCRARPLTHALSLMIALAIGPLAVAQDAVRFTIHPDRPQQVVWGMGFEIQSDSIESGNQGITDSMISVPHDLVPAERDRLADEMLKGFRFCRLAGGLYWRGLDADQKHLQPRWPEQLTELKTLLDRAGVESLSFEYWSSAPFWKANRSYTPLPGDAWNKNRLRCFDPAFANDEVYKGDVDRFLADFAQAVCRDIATLQSAGLKVGFFGLQNEPYASTPYPSCPYEVDEYARAFPVVASAIRQAHPSVKIIADTGDAQPNYIAPVLKNPKHANLVDYLVIHAVGKDSATVKDDVARSRQLVSQPLPIYQNEYEYLTGPATPDRCLNTVQNIMNWYQLAESPTWYWIHCLKPVGNAEASGYSLGFWKPTGPLPKPAFASQYPPFKALADLKPGHFAWNEYNWFSVVGFLKHMPWDSTVVKIDEPVYHDDRRLLAFRRPDGKLVVVVSNRTGRPVRFDIDLATQTANETAARSRFTGHRYTPHDAGPNFLGQPAGTTAPGRLTLDVPHQTWEFWVEQ